MATHSAGIAECMYIDHTANTALAAHTMRETICFLVVGAVFVVMGIASFMLKRLPCGSAMLYPVIGAAQLAHTFGFPAVFAAGVAMRRVEHCASSERSPAASMPIWSSPSSRPNSMRCSRAATARSETMPDTCADQQLARSGRGIGGIDHGRRPGRCTLVDRLHISVGTLG